MEPQKKLYNYIKYFSRFCIVGLSLLSSVTIIILLKNGKYLYSVLVLITTIIMGSLGILINRFYANMICSYCIDNRTIRFTKNNNKQLEIPSSSIYRIRIEGGRMHFFYYISSKKCKITMQISFLTIHGIKHFKVNLDEIKQFCPNVQFDFEYE